MTLPVRLLRHLAAVLLLAGAGSAQAASVSFYLDQSNANPQIPDGVNYLEVTISDVQYGSDVDAIRIDVTVLDALVSLADTNFGIQSFLFNTDHNGASVLAAITGLPSGWSKHGDATRGGFGAFQLLGQMALMHQLPEEIKPSQVRCALTAVIRRMIEARHPELLRKSK